MFMKTHKVSARQFNDQWFIHVVGPVTGGEGQLIHGGNAVDIPSAATSWEEAIEDAKKFAIENLRATEEGIEVLTETSSW